MAFGESEGSWASRIPFCCPQLRGRWQPGSGTGRGAASCAQKTAELEAPQNHPSGAGVLVEPWRVGHGTQAFCHWPSLLPIRVGGQERCWLIRIASCPAPDPPALPCATPTGGIQLLRALKIGWCPCHGVSNFSWGVSSQEASGPFICSRWPGCIHTQG